MKYFLVILNLLFCSSGTYAEQISSYENQLLQSIQFMQQGDHGQAMSLTRSILDEFPNSKLGQMLYADLLLAKTQPLSSVGSGLQSKANRQNFLLELKQRLSHQQSPALQGFIPDNILFLADRHSHAIVVDLEQSRIYVYKNQAGKPVLQTSYFSTIGLRGIGKNKRGDQKTPIGVYHVTRYIDDKELPDLYGSGAFPINYPNIWDKRKKRTGDGIWLHGTPSYTYNRAPLASNGCIVVSNLDFEDIDLFIQAENQTPVLVVDHINWLSPESWRQQRNEMKQVFSNWIIDWESLEFDRFKRHYSEKNYQAHGRNYKNWVRYQRKINSKKTYINVEYENLNMFRYPGEKDLILMQFDQFYQSNNLKINLAKQLFWMKSGSEENISWKIVYEGRRDNGIEKITQARK